MKTVLYAEDYEDDVFFMRRAFGRIAPGASLFIVNNGAEAITYLSGKVPFQDRQAHPLPTLVLLDLSMPITNGFEVLAWIRSQPDLKALPVVVLTSSNNESDRARAANLGATDYLVKPGQPDHLVDVLLPLEKFWV